MTVRVLFSPVGDTDPVRNHFDGPLLHIVRFYKPQKVYLFLTSEMERRNNEDNRYVRCVHFVNKEISVKIIKSGIEAAHDFDQFNGVFGRHLDKIHKLNPDAEIILNISSGTPQIQLALCLEAAMGHHKYKAVQVASPARSSNRDNRPEGQNFDLDQQMKSNLDQENPDVPNRCHEPDLLVVRRNNLRERILSLIREYEYAGALAVAKTEGAILEPSVIALLEHAALRANLQTKAAQKKLAAIEGVDLFPVTDAQAKILSEFFMVARIRQVRGAVADFAMKLSPLLAGMIFFYIHDGVKYNWKSLTKIEHAGRHKLERKKIEDAEPDFLKYLDAKFSPAGFRTADISLYHGILLLEFLKGKKRYVIDCQILDKFKELRHYEEQVRHVAAHQIVPITEATILNTAVKINQEHSSCSSHMTVQKLREEIEVLLKSIFTGRGTQYRFIYDDINLAVEQMMS